MILRRLGAAIRSQDWFTVAIEFVIVVAGVLFALQVNKWNEARTDREQAQSYPARIISDLKNDIVGPHRSADGGQRMILRRVIEHLRAVQGRSRMAMYLTVACGARK